MPFLSHNQQHQSTQGNSYTVTIVNKATDIHSNLQTSAAAHEATDELDLVDDA